MPSKIEKLDQLLSQVGVRVVFTQEAVRDYKSFPLSSRQLILEMIVKQAQKGAKLKPDGTGVPLACAFALLWQDKANIYKPTHYIPANKPQGWFSSDGDHCNWPPG
ncbi:MAG: hypothetical protein ACOX2G_07955 [Bacillota bacterium]